MKIGKSILNILGVNKLVDSASDYFEDKMALIKLEVKEEMAQVIAKMIVGVVLLVLLMFFLFFITFCVAVFINEKMESYYYGFLVVSGFYLAVFFILYIFRKAVGLESFVERLIKKSIK